MLVKIDTDNLIKLIKPSLLWSEIGILAPIVDDKFEYVDEPNVEDIAEFLDSLTLVKKSLNEKEYNIIKALYDNGIDEPSGIGFDFIYHIDLETETAVCGIMY